MIEWWHAVNGEASPTASRAGSASATRLHPGVTGVQSAVYVMRLTTQARRTP